MAATTVAQSTDPIPQPRRPGGADAGPLKLGRDLQNPDLLIPPSTDHGTPAEPALLVRRCSLATGNRRLGSSGDGAQARNCQEHRRRQYASQCRRRTRVALTSQRGRMAIRHRRPGPDGHICRYRAGSQLRLPRRRCRLCAVGYGPLHREYQRHTPAVPGPELVTERLMLDQQVIDALRKEKVPVVPA